MVFGTKLDSPDLPESLVKMCPERIPDFQSPGGDLNVSVR